MNPGGIGFQGDISSQINFSQELLIRVGISGIDDKEFSSDLGSRQQRYRMRVIPWMLPLKSVATGTMCPRCQPAGSREKDRGRCYLWAAWPESRPRWLGKRCSRGVIEW